MADEPDENAETPEESDAEAQPVAEQDAGEAQASEQDAGEAPADEAAGGSADDAAAEGEPAEEAVADAGGGETPEELPPKQRRRRARSQHTGSARPSRSPEERHTERVEQRREKARKRRARRLSEREKASVRRASAPPAEPLPPVHAPVEGKRRVRQGVVVSDKAEKTITVRIDIARRHRRYEKIVRSSSTVHAHDENNDAHEGDVVRVIESRPLSRSKRWALVDVLERAR